MIGVFDSGVGGLTAIRELRRLNPSVDICFLADRENAPYGTKSESELVELVCNDIKRLTLRGADVILMACCTASTVFRHLPRSMRKISHPIISPAARRAAEITQNGRIGVIATERTVASSAFSRELAVMHGVKSAVELSAQPLVSLVESGVTDSNITDSARDRIYEIIKPLRRENIDTLILGCTHFPHLYTTVAGMLPGVRLVSPSREGAMEILRKTSPLGRGEILFI